jgi:alcohol dehydrogenase class IV
MPLVFDYYGASASRRLGRLADVINVSHPEMNDAQKASAFIEAIRGFNRAYGIAETIPELKESDFAEIADSIHWECIPYPVPKIMDDNDVFTILRKLKG